MVPACPLIAPINLLLALLVRWLHLAPSARFIGALERTERLLAQAMRATLREDGVNFPDLPDREFLVWFKSLVRGESEAPRRRPARNVVSFFGRTHRGEATWTASLQARLVLRAWRLAVQVQGKPRRWPHFPESSAPAVAGWSRAPPS